MQLSLLEFEPLLLLWLCYKLASFRMCYACMLLAYGVLEWILCWMSFLEWFGFAGNGLVSSSFDSGNRGRFFKLALELKLEYSTSNRLAKNLSPFESNSSIYDTPMNQVQAYVLWLTWAQGWVAFTTIKFKLEYGVFRVWLDSYVVKNSQKNNVNQN